MINIDSKCPVCGAENGINSFDKIFPLEKDSVQCKVCDETFSLPNWITPLYFAEYILLIGVLLIFYFVSNIIFGYDILGHKIFDLVILFLFQTGRILIARNLIPIEKRVVKNESSENLPFCKSLKKKLTCPSCGTENCIDSTWKNPALLRAEKGKCKNCGVEVCALARYSILNLLVLCVVLYLLMKLLILLDNGILEITSVLLISLCYDVSRFFITYFVPLRVW